MKKNFTHKELQQKAEVLFKENPQAPKAFVTEDGQPFLMENRAQIHAKNKKIKYFTFDNNVSTTAEQTTDEELTKPNQKETVKLVKAATTLDELKKLKEGETRVTVLAEIAKMEKKLQEGSPEKSDQENQEEQSENDNPGIEGESSENS